MPNFTVPVSFVESSCQFSCTCSLL